MLRVPEAFRRKGVIGVLAVAYPSPNGDAARSLLPAGYGNTKPQSVYDKLSEVGYFYVSPVL
ncbi:hypothetical protein NIES25_10920 [Nostoc linckia NIES-25]|nr:hypothetical protein NIES25_10920 [Nostoc linckia NIES-25]